MIDGVETQMPATVSLNVIVTGEAVPFFIFFANEVPTAAHANSFPYPGTKGTSKDDAEASEDGKEDEKSAEPEPEENGK